MSPAHSSSPLSQSNSVPLSFNFSTVPGYFVQDDAVTNPDTFDPYTQNFGLKNLSYASDDTYDPEATRTQWERFAHHVRTLNDQSPSNEAYKVLWLARHGEGFHNVAEAHYGTDLWDCYWSKLDGDTKEDGGLGITWADAKLTERGVAQALHANAGWHKALEEQHMPAPQSYYVSPLTRCMQTARYTFNGSKEEGSEPLHLPAEYPFEGKALVKELLRETIGIHTCDRRSSRSYIKANFSDFKIEKGFTEIDELWPADLRETAPQQTARLKKLLDDVFAHDRAMFISFTSHSGTTAAILRAIGHREFQLQPGGVIPVLIKAEIIKRQPAPSNLGPSSRAPECTINPTQSANGAPLTTNSV